MSDLDDLEDLVMQFGAARRSTSRQYNRASQPSAHCRRGHAMTPDNTYEYVDKSGYLQRQCKRCKKLLKICRLARPV